MLSSVGLDYINQKFALGIAKAAMNIISPGSSSVIDFGEYFSFFWGGKEALDHAITELPQGVKMLAVSCGH